MPQRILVTGGSGFVGSAVIQELLTRGLQVNALVNRKALSIKGEVRNIAGGLFNARALDQAAADCQAVIHLVGIIRENSRRNATFDRIHIEGTREVLAAATKLGIRRFIHMSALGVRPNAASRYHQTKWEAEGLVRQSGLDWTILRPSLIHGPEGEFMRTVAAWAKGKAPPYFFMPYFGNGLLGLGGAGQLQPVYIADVARAFVDCLGNPKTIGQSYDLGGQDRLSWREFHKAAAAAIVGRARPVLAIPVWYAKLLTKIAPARLLPFNIDQVVMSQEDNTCDLTPFKADFGWEPREFAAALESYSPALAG